MSESAPFDETDRLAALEKLHVLYSEHAPEFDSIVEMAADIFACPKSVISIVGRDEQWFKAKHGVESGGGPRNDSLCTQAIMSHDLLIVEDASKDPRFCNLPSVTGESKIRFYAGVPISSDGIHKIGVLCVLDTVPRKMSEREGRLLCSLGKTVEALILALENKRIAQERTDELTITLENMDEAVTVFDSDARLVLWNQRYLEIFEKSPAEVKKGVTLYELVAGQNLEEGFEGGYEKMLEELKAGLEKGQTVPGGVRLNSGRIISSLHAPMPHGGWVATHSDITEQVETSERITHASLHDGLTGLANRTKFINEFERRISTTEFEEQLLVIMLIDVDHFKDVNDSFGHHTGDRVIMDVATRLQQCVRDQDLVARLGGDEFALILDLEGGDSDALPGQIAERIIAAMAQPIYCDGNCVNIGVSIGCAVTTSKTRDLETILSRADHALYQVKENGRGHCQFYNREIERGISAIRNNDIAVRKACLESDFHLNFQPIVDLKNPARRGFEALIRWSEKQPGYLAASTVIETAERNGTIVDIGAWVLNKAMQEAAQWQEDAWLAVNISPRQLGQGSLIQQVETALARWNCDPCRLELEVTETALLKDNDSSIKELYQLKNMGIGIVLDDFGTGYSSMTYLQRFPFDKLKIDRSFVSGAELNRHSPAIIRAITGLASDTQMETVAEGIETPAQFEAMRDAGCTYGQGYFLARPMTAAELHPAQLETALAG